MLTSSEELIAPEHYPCLLGRSTVHKAAADSILLMHIHASVCWIQRRN